MVRRLDDYEMHPAERDAAVKIHEAAAAVQHLFYYSYAGDELPDETREMLTRLYRGLRLATLHYIEDHGLQWEAPKPGTPFTKVRK